MARKNAIKLFEDKLVRSVWDDEKEEWFFSVNDVVEILTDSKDPKQYIKKMRSRDEELNLNWGTICTPLQMIGKDGKKREIQSANAQGLFRIIQSIPSKKAEPFKQWLAKVGAERLDQLQDPELSIKQGLEENAQCAHEGGTVAAVARRELESKTGRSVVTPLNAKDYFAAQIESKKEQLYLPVRNFILGTGLSFGFSNEKVRVDYKDSYFYIDQLYYHIPSRRNVLLKICRKNLTATEKKEFKEQIEFYNSKNKRENENDAVGMLFIISDKKIEIDYVIPDNIGKTAQELSLPETTEFDSFLQKSLEDLRMN